MWHGARVPAQLDRDATEPERLRLEGELSDLVGARCPRGGALAKMLTLFRLGLGGRIGD